MKSIRLYDWRPYSLSFAVGPRDSWHTLETHLRVANKNDMIIQIRETTAIINPSPYGLWKAYHCKCGNTLYVLCSNAFGATCLCEFQSYLTLLPGFYHIQEIPYSIEHFLT